MVLPEHVARVEYPVWATEGFDEATVPTSPLSLFHRWLADAAAAGLPEPNAAALATVDSGGRPAIRTVLVKLIDERGFTFFTNYGSRKAVDLAGNPAAALLFGWQGMHRQVAVRGPATRLGRAESQAYFASRPRGAQIGAWASRQSQATTRAALDVCAERLRERFEGEEIPAPEFWGGFLVSPESIEFWVGRASRLHDRIEYLRTGPGGLADGSAWDRRRLAP